MARLRIGTLGAARITPMSLIGPARRVPDVEIAAVAARDHGRAVAFAAKHGIAKVHDSYEALLADPSVDAVYNPLPNALHCQWTLAAIEAGKHVLCEKPFTSNAAEARRVEAAAAGSNVVVMEAFHYRYHPLAQRMREVVESGELGAIRSVETWMCIPLPIPGDIRYRYGLAGGATMDVGSYSLHMQRQLAGGEPEVLRASPILSSPKVDRAMTAELALPGGGRGVMHCSLLSSTLLKIAAHVRGERGEMRVFNPVAPQIAHRFRVRAGSGSWRSERFPGDSSYVCQLRAFAAAVLDGAPILTPPSDSVATMELIDAVYLKAGLPLRGES